MGWIYDGKSDWSPGGTHLSRVDIAFRDRHVSWIRVKSLKASPTLQHSNVGIIMMGQCKYRRDPAPRRNAEAIPMSGHFLGGPLRKGLTNLAVIEIHMIRVCDVTLRSSELGGQSTSDRRGVTWTNLAVIDSIDDIRLCNITLQVMSQ